MIFCRSKRCASDNLRDPHAITQTVSSSITSVTVHTAPMPKRGSSACFLSLGIVCCKNVPIRIECTAWRPPTSADFTSQRRALITELHEPLEYDVDHDNDMIIKISANWISVNDTKFPCSALQVLRNDWQLEMYFIAARSATLSKIRFR